MNSELLKLIEEISALEVENANIEDEIKYLLGDKTYFENERYCYLSSCLVATSPITLPGIVIYTALINRYEFLPSSEWGLTQKIGILINILAALIGGSYALKRRKLYKQNRCDEAIEQLSSQIYKLENMHSDNLRLIQELNNKLPEFKSCIADLCIQQMAEDNTSYNLDPVQKTIGTYE